ncbi:MAG: ABC transporter ATP-binding protein [Anaerolineales bacterium]|nr:MAG: ABC transporter ATP-binding protein [Anaerolineales bacterium]
MSSAEPLLIAESISMTFPNGNGGLEVLEQITLSAQPQEFICIVGPSGCGKTTLLRILGALLKPTLGEVLFGGEKLAQPRRRIGFVFQEANLMPWRTAVENILLPLELDGITIEQAQTRAGYLIRLLGLEGFEAALPRDLSGGMAQRVAIGRALVHQPELLLLDEPFGSLDALTRERMGTELLRVWETQRATVMMVTHSITEAVLLADRVLVLSERPARIVLDLPIPLERPRSLELTYTPEFGALASQVRSAIRI